MEHNSIFKAIFDWIDCGLIPKCPSCHCCDGLDIIFKSYSHFKLNIYGGTLIILLSVVIKYLTKEAQENKG